jgi:creatinine amidohydrolase
VNVLGLNGDPYDTCSPVPLAYSTRALAVSRNRTSNIGGLRQFPGSYSVRADRLQAVFVDLASAIGERGFRWVFLVHGHGAPAHMRALDTAAAHFNSHYSGHMVHLSGLPDVWGKCSAVVERRLPAAALAEDAQSLHAGAWETSVLLALRSDLVEPAYRDARPLPAAGLIASGQVARTPGWPGYFGSPRIATRAIGDECLEVMSAAYTNSALRIIDDASKWP